jgi:isocitrate dehydrogenase
MEAQLYGAINWSRTEEIAEAISDFLKKKAKEQKINFLEMVLAFEMVKEEKKSKIDKREGL